MDRQYFKILEMYIIGIFVVIIGIVILALAPQLTAMSFVIMLIGLALSVIGAAQGRKRMLERSYQGSDLLENVTGYIPEEHVEETEAKQETKSLKESLAQKISKISQKVSKPQEQITPQQTQQNVFQGQSQPETQQVKVIKIMVCPKCGAENQLMNKYCYNCGNRLKPEEPKKHTKKRKK